MDLDSQVQLLIEANPLIAEMFFVDPKVFMALAMAADRRISAGLAQPIETGVCNG